MPARWAKEEDIKIDQRQRSDEAHAANSAANPCVSVPPSFETLEDVQLVKKMLAGHQEALAVLLLRYEGLIYRVANRVLRDSGEAEDTVQIVFRDIYLSAKQFDERKGSFKAWVLQYAITRAKNRRRDLQRQGIYKWDSIDDVTVRESRNKTSGPSQAAVQERDQLLANCLSKVTSDERTTVELRHFHGLSWKEVAAHTRESIAVVRKRVDRAIKKMRAACKGEM